MRSGKKGSTLRWITLAIVLVIILVLAFFIKPMLQTSSNDTLSTTQYQTEVPFLSEIDESKLEIISNDPDFILNLPKIEEWPEDYPIPLTEYTVNLGDYVEVGDLQVLRPFLLQREQLMSFPLEGNAFYYPDSIPENSDTEGVFILPVVLETTFLEQSVDLEKDNQYVLVAKIANIYDFMGGDCSCADSIIRIKILDTSTEKEDTIYEAIVNSKDGWKDVFLDISRYNGKSIKFRIESDKIPQNSTLTDELCETDCGYWASAVDKFYVGKFVS